MNPAWFVMITDISQTAVLLIIYYILTHPKS